MKTSIWAAAVIFAAVTSVGCSHDKSDHNGNHNGNHNDKRMTAPARTETAAPVAAATPTEGNASYTTPTRMNNSVSASTGVKTTEVKTTAVKTTETNVANTADKVATGKTTELQAAGRAEAAKPSESSAAVAAVQGAVAETAGTYAKFGFPMKTDPSSAIPVSTVLRDIEKYDGKTLRVSGTVDKVCAKKGCWLSMKDEQTQRSMMVKFTCPVDGRLIPMEAAGKPVVIEGKVISKEVTEEYARHLLEEEGLSAEEAAKKIVGPQKQYSIQSPAAQVAM